MAVNVLYYARGSGITINGSATGPTTTQGGFLNMIRASCIFGVTADAQALITHNMGLDASAPTYLDPEVFWEPQSTTTYLPLLTFDRTNTNVLKVNKPATDGPTTVLVTIRRSGLFAGPWQ
jgi:hypothetical protein